MAKTSKNIQARKKGRQWHASRRISRGRNFVSHAPLLLLSAPGAMALPRMKARMGDVRRVDYHSIDQILIDTFYTCLDACTLHTELEFLRYFLQQDLAYGLSLSFH